ncbi:MAG: glycosyl hydrolase 115 family protein [Acetatifactor sp.]
MSGFTVNRELVFWGDENSFPGVKRVAEKVKNDVELVVGGKPGDHIAGKPASHVLIYGTIGKSRVLDELAASHHIDLSRIRGKREVYLFHIVEHPTEEIESAIVIAGSDKRGTIYGLFHFSELIGVSPFVNWNHVWPEKKSQICLSETVNMVSEEPSVKYRGFFINDEWPAFGTWAMKHFGGINAKCYEGIFELLLRLKGNYLWPAMWNSNFNLDGPGLQSAELADEYGIVMSTSHHEPCMRSGQEYGMLRGADSIYGDAWDFNSNPEGIKRFWRDGLLRNRSFENVITMGMRGENDTAIMQNASLEENIDMLRRVIRAQNQLIRETISEDVSQVPRQIVLFTEVEEFFYGNKMVKGLIGDEELEGVTLMLSDNNHGSTRTLPSEEMRNHHGGYGMYYHMDMHGGAHSFQWIGSTYLPKVWEQMTAAYEYGVQEIWVTNVGDIGTQELGLSFFLDMAYDMKKWGGRDAGITREYIKEWIEKNFSGKFEQNDLKKMEGILWEYTGLLARRKHEVMNDTVYHPVHFGEAQEVLDRSQSILDTCLELKRKCAKEHMAAYLSLVFYPACGTANLMKLWIISGRNKLYASQNRLEANRLADMIPEIEAYDEELVKEYMEIDDGYFDGFGLSEHIGFTTWCDEDNKYPQRIYIRPSNQSRMIVARTDDERYLTGDPWRDRPQIWEDALRPDVNQIAFDIARASKEPIHFRITTDCPWLSFSCTEGTVEETKRIIAFIDRKRFTGKVQGNFYVENVGHTKAHIIVNAYHPDEFAPENCFWEQNGYVAMEASHFQRKCDVQEGGFGILEPYGRTGSAIKVFPVTADFLEKHERPYVEYDFCVSEQGEYIIQFYMAATTPVVYEGRQYLGFAVNDNAIRIENTVEDESRQFFLSPQWSKEAYSNIKLLESRIICRQGTNTLRFYGVSPAIVLERIVIHKSNMTIPKSYLGPGESYFHRG